LVEARVFGCNHGMLEIGRDLAERNEFIAFVIRSVVSPGLQAALDVHRGGGWVDPPGGEKKQRGERPNEHRTDGKPSNEGSKKALAKPCLTLWLFSHISE
jgi:hypothetical protein